MPASPADLPHLARRFIGYLRASSLDPSEQLDVANTLEPGEQVLFWGMNVQDQRHSFDVAAAVRDVLSADVEVARAALLHDVGKRHPSLGPWQRSIATLLDMARLPVTDRQRAYLDHGPVGAADLEAIGSPPIVVEFARLHPGPAPTGIDPSRWQVLLDADDE